MYLPALSFIADSPEKNDQSMHAKIIQECRYTKPVTQPGGGESTGGTCPHRMSGAP